MNETRDQWARRHHCAHTDFEELAWCNEERVRHANAEVERLRAELGRLMQAVDAVQRSALIWPSKPDTLRNGEVKPCCGDFANCAQACTPRGEWKACADVERLRELARAFRDASCAADQWRHRSLSQMSKADLEEQARVMMREAGARLSLFDAIAALDAAKETDRGSPSRNRAAATKGTQMTDFNNHKSWEHRGDECSYCHVAPFNATALRDTLHTYGRLTHATVRHLIAEVERFRSACAEVTGRALENDGLVTLSLTDMRQLGIEILPEEDRGCQHSAVTDRPTKETK